MDWTFVIERNREALRRILAILVTMAGLDGAFTASRETQAGRRAPDGRVDTSAAAHSDVSRRPVDGREEQPAPTLPRHLHRAILALLRPAEAAARRLIIVAARDLPVTPPPPARAKPRLASLFVRAGKGTGILLPHGVLPGTILPGLAPSRRAPRRLALPLLDALPRRRGHRAARAAGVPRISMPGVREPLRRRDRRPPTPHDPINATRLALRLGALGRVLDDLPREARRFARWRNRAAGAAAAARDGKNAAGRFRRIWPLRPGRPPGGRHSTHTVHDVLRDLQHFAFLVLEQGKADARRDTS